jgi:hypothetical protein
MSTDRLDQLAREITTLFRLERQSAAQYVQRVLATAAKVAEAHKTGGWDAWEAWVRANLPFGPRQARNYLDIHRNREAIRNRSAELPPGARISIAGLLGLARETPGSNSHTSSSGSNSHTKSAEPDDEPYPDPGVARARLLKLLAMLRSNHDHEVVAAAKKLERFRLRLSLEWDQIVRDVLPRRGARNHSPRRWAA